MDNEEEELKKPEEALTTQKSHGGYAMVSRERVRRGVDKVVGALWDHDLDRESGDNDPNKRFNKKK